MLLRVFLPSYLSRVNPSEVLEQLANLDSALSVALSIRHDKHSFGRSTGA